MLGLRLPDVKRAEASICVPIYPPEVVARTVLPVVGELDPCSTPDSEVLAHQAVYEVTSHAERKPVQLAQVFPIYEGRTFCGRRRSIGSSSQKLRYTSYPIPDP